MATNLLSSTSRIETPFIVVNIAGYTFGAFNKNVKTINTEDSFFKSLSIQYPNYMQSLSIVKTNGTFNTYTLTMKYQITSNDDPNLLEKIFSKAKSTRTLVLQYGDLAVPNYIYREEEALINRIKSKLDVNNSSITYTILCTSKSLLATTGTFSFDGYTNTKPSDVIKKILYDTRYNLLEVFYGMQNKTQILSFHDKIIADDDAPVTIQAQTNITPLDYLNYLVSCMSPDIDSADSTIKSGRYALVVLDDYTNILGGPYFKVIKVGANITTDSIATYEIDVGYPSTNYVTRFDINEDDSYSILYDYSKDVKQSDYISRINDDGDIIYEYSPTVAKSNKYLKTTESDKIWWTQMTQFPITATLDIKGLLKPALLMTQVKITTYFYGRKHISSGLYLITKQVDTIDASGYRTTLSLTRIGGVDYGD